jgi:hypothetical protein
MSNERCPNCDMPLDAERGTCPYCRAPRGLAALAREDDAGGRAIEAGLARMMTETLLAKNEAAELLMLDRELEVAGPLAPSELGAALARMADADPSLDELEQLLARDANDIAMDGIQLASLVDHTGDDVKILKRGLLFLRHRRFSEACEWWNLQRQALDPSQRRFELLLLLMEAFTQTLAGDGEAAARTRRRIREHTEYARLKSKARK